MRRLMPFLRLDPTHNALFGRPENGDRSVSLLRRASAVFAPYHRSLASVPIFLCLLPAVLIAFPASAAFDLADWTWQSEVGLGESPPGFVRVTLTPEVFDQSQGSLNDLRVLDGDAALVPYVIYRGRARDVEKVAWRPAQLLNRTFQPEKYNRVTLDFGERVKKNRIRVRLSQTNFRRRVLIEGSDDGTNWDIVAENKWLFDIHLPDKEFTVDTLDLRTNDFRYLRLTAYNMPDDPRRIEIESVEGALAEKLGEAELTPVPVTIRSVTHDEKKQQTIYELDLGFRNLPMVSMEFGFGEPYFYRGYELLGRNTETEAIERRTETGWDVTERERPWRSIHRGLLHRIHHEGKVSESKRIEPLNAPYRCLELRVFDGDDAPLDLTNVTAMRRKASLVFESEPGRRYRLVGGNPKASAPRFDLGRSIEGVGERDVPVVVLGALVPIQHEPEVPPWTERNTALVWVVLIVAVGVMLTLILKNARKVSTR